MRCWIVTWLAVAGTSLLAEDTRKPAPVPLEQESAEEAIRELYAKQFGSKDLETRRALAKKLLSEADLERDDVARFVLLKNARDLGREVGDFGVAFRAIEEMARDYRLEELTLKREVLEGASTSKLDLIAKERRTDSNPDYANEINQRAGVIDVEHSKFLGGDEEHTHLVKGLDLALLRKVRADASAAAVTDYTSIINFAIVGVLIYTALPATSQAGILLRTRFIFIFECDSFLI